MSLTYRRDEKGDEVVDHLRRGGYLLRHDCCFELTLREKEEN